MALAASATASTSSATGAVNRVFYHLGRELSHVRRSYAQPQHTTANTPCLELGR